MAEIKVTLVDLGDQRTLSAFYDGRSYVATDSHPHWDKILNGVLADDPDALRYFDLKEAVAEKFERLSERVALVGGNITFDGDVVDNSLTKQVLRFLEEGVEDWKPLVAFWEKLQTNPSEYSREQLYKFLDKNDFAVTADGDIVAYKGVALSNKEGFKYASVHSGSNSVTVDGVSDTGRVHQNVGSVVEMARSVVNSDADSTCSTGLHVSTYRYAQSYAGGGMLRVLVNPRDVVSVPNEASAEKVRVSRYVVDAVVSEPFSGPVWAPEADYDEEDDHTYDEYWCDICEGSCDFS